MAVAVDVDVKAGSTDVSFALCANSVIAEGDDAKPALKPALPALTRSSIALTRSSIALTRGKFNDTFIEVWALRGGSFSERTGHIVVKKTCRHHKLFFKFLYIKSTP